MTGLRETFFGLVVITASLGLACGSTSPDSGSTGGADGGGGGGDGTAPADGPLGFGDGARDGVSTCSLHCSSDLHDVLDCNNKVVTMCPPSQGCGGSGCVAACDAAKANKSTIGCDYYSVDPDIIPEGAGFCFAAYIANTWGSPVTITVDRAGTPYNVASFARIPQGSGKTLTYMPLPNGQLPPAQVAILFLAQFGAGLACPAGITPAFTTADAAIHGTGMGDAFHISTDAPVVGYDIFPYGGGSAAATSATLLLPSTAWDTNYIAVTPYEKDVTVAMAQPSLDIVASQDGTTVTISPTAAILPGAGVAGTGMGVPATYNLNKGQILQFTQDAALVGSPIQSNKPVAMWAAASCLNIPVDSQACDSAHQQIPPVKALGNEYVAVRYRNRIDNQEETVPWRMVGAVTGTTLTYDPAPPSGAPLTLDVGTLAEFQATGPFSVKSQDVQHPFYMSGHMTGGGPLGGYGDPEFVNIIPPQQYLATYTFFTDPTYPETNLVFVRTKGMSGFVDVNLDCAGNLAGWQPLGSAGNYEYTRIDLVRHDFAPQNGCDNGLHIAKSTQPFGLTVWGWGTPETSVFSQYVSYAYPSGASVQPINTVVVPPTPK